MHPRIRNGDTMKLLRLHAVGYRSLRDVTVELGDINVFIGANAAGKSAILDALRLLHHGLVHRDFRTFVYPRGGITNLLWKGEGVSCISLLVEAEDRADRYEWGVRLRHEGHDLRVTEEVWKTTRGQAPARLLEASDGVGSWWSDTRVSLKQEPTMCALAAAAADASFPGRPLAEFVGRWGFFDPDPFLLHRYPKGLGPAYLDPYGRDLAQTLFNLQRSAPEDFDRVVSATQAVLGLPARIEPHRNDDGFYLVQHERGLRFPVRQDGVSSGTLRMLALMAAVVAAPEAMLVGLEEPENHFHPTALQPLVEHLAKAQKRVQLLVTTHSPLFLDCLDDPASVKIVRRGNDGATHVLSEANGDAVREALNQSGFGLGAFHETKGFGATRPQGRVVRRG